MGPKTGLDGCGKSRPHQDSITEPSSPQLVAIPTELSRPTYSDMTCTLIQIQDGSNMTGTDCV